MSKIKSSRHPDRWKHRVINTIRRLSGSKTPTTDVGMCLRNVREVLGAGPLQPDAIAAWNAARFKHRGAPIPAPAPIFWAGGSAGHGHVAVKAFKRGHCWTVDKLRPGYWNRVPIASITNDWHLAFLGWTEDINGQRVYYPDGR